MKKLLLFMAVALIAAQGMAAFSGGTFYYGSTQLNALGELRLSNPPGGTNGGPFAIYDASGPAKNGVLVWCVENEIPFSPNIKYWYSIDWLAYSGNKPAGDPITDVTDYIYRTWNSGNPNGWTDSQINKAIWYAEEETGGTASQAYIDALVALGYPAGTLPKDLGVSKWTHALNLWVIDQQDAQGNWIATDKQSHTYVPAPGALLLGSLGVGLVGWLRRRQSV